MNDGVVTSAEIARLAGVGRAAVSNWRKRHADFPAPAGGNELSPTFRRAEVEAWLQANGKLAELSAAERLGQRLDAFRWSARTAQVLAGVGVVLLRGSAAPDLAAWAERERPGLAPATGGDVVDDVLALGVDALAAAAHEGATELFDRLVMQYVDARAGQVHATPPDLATLMVDVVGAGRVLDPACGTGSLLRAAAAGGVTALLGQDVEPAAVLLCRVRLALAGHDARIEVDDSLRDDAFRSERVDAVVCNPPFAVRDWGHDELFSDERWAFGMPPRGESELAWVQHCLAHLNPGGRAALVLPPGVGVRPSGRRIRAELLRRGAVVAVVALPPGALPESGISPQLWVLRADGDPDAPVLFVDASASGGSRRVDWTAIRRRVGDALTGGDDDPRFARRVPVIELLDDEVALAPQRYVEVAARPAHEIRDTRDSLVTLLARVQNGLPETTPSATPTGARWVPLGELARSAAVTLIQSTGKLNADEDGDGPPVLSARDVVAGRGATRRLAGPEPERAVRVETGDVVVPLLLSRPVARVVEEPGALLDRSLFLVRARPDAFDPWFLAGVLQGDHVLRSTAMVSGSHRLTPRHVEVPVLPLEEQLPLAETFRRLAAADADLRTAAAIGAELIADLRTGLVEGSLTPRDGTLIAPTVAAPSEGDA